ncbi:ATP-binding protein [Halorubrum vacuolatum]|uniref:histidine kinase n=1 Tax=Halorubrum vacuolatum TaxID=63740 RepID=A0A238UMA7_HALVU|nr:ATP-binding protein [Halorubrum vacuolatum]SNR23155.1 PAS domain S-box-containing protein [Halorubrum vacuolatum]
MDREQSDDRDMVVLAAESEAAVGGELESDVRHADPRSIEEGSLPDADVLIVLDRTGLDRIKGSHAATPIVAFVDDPTDPIATDPIVDAVATSAPELAERTRWLVARSNREQLVSDPDTEPSRMERLQAGAARLATARSPEDAYRIAVAIADEILSTRHSIAGVVTDGWIEPVAVSTDEDPADRNRVRVGEGLAGAVIERNEAIVAGSVDHEAYGSALTVPVGEEGILQVVAAMPDAFDAQDLELAELLASHLEETLSRLRVDERLRAERDRLRALFENIPDAAVEYGYEDGVPFVVRVNSAFEETFGYPAEEIVGEPIDDYILPSNTEGVREEAYELNARLQRGENLRREVTRRTAYGIGHFLLQIVPIHLGTENASGYAIYTDVTERREREQMLQRQNDRLDRFTSIVTHDLRNPLSIAKGHLDLARTTGEEERLERVEDALDRMDELITELLSLSRDGHVVGTIDDVRLSEVTREAWAHVDTGDAELVIDADATFQADPTRIRELFENLFGNSIEHGMGGQGSGHDDGTDPLTVSVGPIDAPTEEEADRETRAESTRPIGVYVQDDGVGFDEDPDGIFESGYTTDDDGTGLGLAISEHIAEAHGWEIVAIPAEPEGARFELRFDGADSTKP